MNIRSVRSHKRSLDHQPTKIQTIGQMRLALEWRDCWRAEKLSSQHATVAVVWKDKEKNDDKEKRTRFAKGIARAELGRAYWDERLHRGVEQQPARKEKIKSRIRDR